MNLKKVKKILLVLLFGLCLFLQTDYGVHALDEDEVLCRYEGIWGKIEVYLNFNGEFQYSFVTPSNCGKTIDTSCVKYKLKDTSSNKLSTDFYDFQYNPNEGSYVCPRIYYTYDQKQTAITKKYEKEFTFSPANEYEKYVDSSKGPISTPATDNNSTDCTDEQIAKFNEEYRKHVSDANSKVKSLTKSITGINDYDKLKSRLNGTDADSVRDEYDKIINPIVDDFVKMTSSIGCIPEQDYAERLRNVLNVMKNEAIGDIKEHIKVLELQGRVPEEEQEEIENVVDKLDEDLKQKNATAAETIKTKWLSESGNINIDIDGKVNCEGLLGTDVLADISKILGWIKIGVPIFLILLGALDFGKAVLADDQRAMSVAVKTFTKRAIAAIAVFLAPYIIMYILKKVDAIAGGCDVKTLFNGVIMWKI